MGYCNIDDESRSRLLGYLGSEALGSITAEDETVASKVETPEVDVYLHLLVMIYLLDQGQLEKVRGQEEKRLGLFKIGTG